MGISRVAGARWWHHYEGSLTGTPLHLDRTSTETPGNEALSLGVQSRRRIQLTAVLPVGVEETGPEDLCSCGRARPGERVEILRIDRFGPECELAAKYILRRATIQPGCRIVGVDELPALGRTAPIDKCVWGFRSPDIGAPCNPLTTTAVKILPRNLASTRGKKNEEKNNSKGKH